MSRTLDYPRVTDQLLQGVVRRILSVGTPHKIVLFGSQARGKARPDSDLDLLIVRSGPASVQTFCTLLASTRWPFPNSVVVWTPEEIQAWAAVPHTFITTAFREGKILYARSA